MDDKTDDIKEFVDSRILKLTLKAKNFSKEEMDFVDAYCKLHFGDDRRKMILTLITMVESNHNIKLLDDKYEAEMINLYDELDKVYERLNALDDKKEERPKKMSWKGFGDK